MPLPLDYPTLERPFRVYAALTNHCNRACPWCSTCSHPGGSTYLSLDALGAQLPTAGAFELQLEGGEPTIVPEFWQFVELARTHPRCVGLVLCTNGVVIPRQPARLAAYLARLGTPLVIKLSINHHLLEHDAGLTALATNLAAALGDGQSIVYNVRLRRGVADDDAAVRAAVEAAGLLPRANIFYLQRYGFAVDEHEWEEPFIVSDRFTMVNPDGRAHGADLVARSEAMRVLP